MLFRMGGRMLLNRDKGKLSSFFPKGTAILMSAWVIVLSKFYPSVQRMCGVSEQPDSGKESEGFFCLSCVFNTM